MSDDTFEARAARRNSWPVVRYELGAEPEDAWLAGSGVDSRLDMMWQLALDAWAFSGEALPTYERRNMPGCVTRRRHDTRSGTQ